MTKLALLGGAKTRKKPFPVPPFPHVGIEEKKAVNTAMKEGILSGFVGAPGDAFLGGKYVKQFERLFARKHQVKYAIAVNSCTAALHCSLAAAGVGFGDEVIVTPWSFTASAITPLMHNAIPVFADIEEKSYGLDPASVGQKITKYTKAIILVHLFGQPADISPILKIAKKYKLKVIEDAAQAPLAKYNNRLTGTVGDIGAFSFTASKQMTTCEGGMVITNNKKMAQRAQMIRNHGEVMGTVGTKKNMEGILGWNYRMTEIEAAMGIAQFKKLPRFIKQRQKNAQKLNQHLSKFEFLKVPAPITGRTHSYFIYALNYNQKKAQGVHRDVFIKALQEEGIPAFAGYVAPLYWNPVYRWKSFFGKKQYPFKYHPRKIEYKRGDCPVVEKLHQHQIINTSWCHPKVNDRDINQIVKAIDKISQNLPLLAKFSSK